MDSSQEKTIVCNIFGAPSTKKSTTAAGVFSLLKMHSVNCEYIPEVAKDYAWEGTLGICYNPYRILGEQHHRQFRCFGKTEVIINDSPILQQCVYVPNDITYQLLCIELFSRTNNLNYFMMRTGKYQPEGRRHTEKASRKIDKKILQLINGECIEFKKLQGDYSAVNIITEEILVKLGKTFQYYVSDRYDCERPK